MNDKLTELLLKYGNAHFYCGEYAIDTGKEDEYQCLCDEADSIELQIKDYIKENYEHK